MLAAGEAAAARLVVVEAIDDRGVGSCLHHGSIPAPEHPPRPYRRMKGVRVSLERGE